MKKRVFSMLLVVMMLCSMLSVSVFAADHSAHEAHIATEWSNDASGHWHVCANAECAALAVTEMPDYATHSDTDSNLLCDVCNYNMHSHTWSAADYGKNDTHHWNLCVGAGTCSVTDPASMYGYTAHAWAVDSTNTDTNKVVYTCVCGATKEEHAHVWDTAWQFDDNNHWHECVSTTGTCGITDNASKDGYGAHVYVKDEAASTAANTVYKCVCGKTKTEHVHVWETTLSWDENSHWYACVDPSCTEKNGEGLHYDYNHTGVCDYKECGAAVSGRTITSLTITDLTVPANGAAVDFTVNVAEALYGAPTVKWNRVTNLSTNASVALGTTNTFGADYMYNVSISVPITWHDTVDKNINITLDGVKIPYYSTTEAFNGAVATYEGNNTVYMAREANVGGTHCIVVSAMYAKLPGTHVCTNGADWIETSGQHYHQCTSCGKIADAEYHYDNNKSGLCDVCGFNMKDFDKNATASAANGSGSGTHTHSYTKDYVENANQHWKQCLTCGTKIELGNHVDANNTGKCDVCGFVMKSNCTSHTWSTDYVEDAVHHWKACTVCGTKTAIEKHVDANNSGLCDVCGYTMTVPNTGDNGVVYVWTALLAVCAVGVVMTLSYMKKKEAE